MFGTLVRKELLNNLLNYRFMLAYGAVVVLMVSSFAVMFGDYTARKKDHEINSNLYRNRNFAAVEWESFLGNYRVARPPLLMSTFAVGGEKDPNGSTNLFAPKPSWFKGELSRNPIKAFFPTMDMVFVVGLILSLLVFVLTYDSIAGETEGGTMKVLLCSPVPRDIVFIAKWTGGLLSVAIPFLTSFVIIAIVLYFSKGTSVNASEWLQVAAIVGACLVYLTTVYSMGMMVSALSGSSATVALLLLVVWAVLFAALPAAAPSIAYGALKSENPEKNLLRARISVDAPRPQAQDSTIRAKLRAEAAKYSIDPNSHAPLPEDKQRIAYRLETLWELLMYQIQCRDLNAIFDQLTRQEQAVETLSQWLARLSPYGCLQNACTALAGTGFSRERALRERLQRLSQARSDQMVSDFRLDGTREYIRPQAYPQFVDAHPNVREALGKGLLDVGILALMGVLFFMTGFAAFMRAEVR